MEPGATAAVHVDPDVVGRDAFRGREFVRGPARHRWTEL